MRMRVIVRVRVRVRGLWTVDCGLWGFLRKEWDWEKRHVPVGCRVESNGQIIIPAPISPSKIMPTASAAASNTTWYYFSHIIIPPSSPEFQVYKRLYSVRVTSKYRYPTDFQYLE